MEEVYLASEAIKKLGIPKSTFYYLVAKGDIPKVNVPLRKQAYYSKKVIDELAVSKKERGKEFMKRPERITYKVPNRKEVEELIQIDKSVWGDVGIIDVENVMRRIESNPEYIHIIKDVEENKVCGSISLTRLPDETLQKLIHFKIDEADVLPEECLPYLQETPQDTYIISIVSCRDLDGTYYASRLLGHTEEYLFQLLDRGIIIKHIYSAANTEDGLKLARKIGFQEIQKGKGPLGDERTIVMLDLEEKDSESEIITRYQHILKNRIRRAHRQENQENKEVQAEVQEQTKSMFEYIDKQLQTIKQEIVQETVKEISKLLNLSPK